jgi:hypothetical protein
MLNLFLRSAGAPPAVLDLVQRVQEMGFDAFAMKRAEADDPNWEKFAGGEGNRTGFWLKAQSPTSRACIGVFLEGVDDAILESFVASDKPAVLDVPGDAAVPAAS